MAVFAPPLAVQLEEPIVTTAIGIFPIKGPGVEVTLILSHADPCVSLCERAKCVCRQGGLFHNETQLVLY